MLKFLKDTLSLGAQGYLSIIKEHKKFISRE